MLSETSLPGWDAIPTSPSTVQPLVPHSALRPAAAALCQASPWTHSLRFTEERRGNPCANTRGPALFSLPLSLLSPTVCSLFTGFKRCYLLLQLGEITPHPERASVLRSVTPGRKQGLTWDSEFLPLLKDHRPVVAIAQCLETAASYVLSGL